MRVFNVVRKGWGAPSVVAGPFYSRAEAERERDEWQAWADEAFREGRIMYDVPEFYVEAAGGAREARGRSAGYLRRGGAREEARKRRRRQKTEDTWHVMWQMPGSKWVWATRSGAGTLNPDSALEFADREEAEEYANRMMRPGSSIRARVVSRPKGDVR